MTRDQLLEVLGAPAGVGAGLGLVVLGGRAVIGWVRGGGERRLRRRATSLVGDDRHPGFLDRLDEHGRQLAAIQAQLRPDSGRSLHDVLVRVDERTMRIERRLDAHIATPHPPPAWPMGRH